MTEHDETRGRGPIEHKAVATRAAVIVPALKADAPERHSEQPRRSDDARLSEAVGLAAAIDLAVIASAIVTVSKARPATLMGSGKVEELKGIVATGEIGLVVVDHPLTPVQQRNLEKALGAKVIDRTGLILEIFGRRARTKEGRLQVELAHLNYQKGRLVRSWTHLERQRGGAGFLGGPGETQIESDRRQLQEKIKRLEKELDAVRQTRSLHRSKRKKTPHPVVALVGYTNAGKSTLFNAVTGAGVLAKDLLFATLDPTLRRITLPHGTEAMLSDTVGFISDLPTHLVAAFRATLEEVVEAELILHVRDIADADSSNQAVDVRKILADLEIDAGDDRRVIEVWNKADRLSDAQREQLTGGGDGEGEGQGPHLVSALTGEGIPRLLADVEQRLAGLTGEIRLAVSADGMSILPWLYENATVSHRTDREDGGIDLTLAMTSQAQSTLRRMASKTAGVRLS